MRYWVKLAVGWVGPFAIRDEAEKHGSDIWLVGPTQARAWVRD